MTKDYSRLLIHDWVLPDRGCHLLPTLMDITMMSVLMSMEWTRNHFFELLDTMGLKIVKFWEPKEADESVIEAVLKG
jgi:hypothetical protein